MKMKLSVKIVGGFLIGSLAALVVGFIGVSKINVIKESDMAMYEIQTKPLGNMGSVGTHFQIMRGVLKDVFLAKFVLDKNVDQHVNRIRELDKEVQEDLAQFEKSVRTDDVRKEYESLKSALSQYYPVRDKIIGLAVEGKKDEAFTLLYSRGAEVARQAEGAIANLFEFKIGHAKAASDGNTATANSAVMFTWIAAGTGTLIAILAGLYLAASITRPINRVVQGLGEASDQVAAASSQVSGASRQLAEGASEQAASIEETSSSLEEMSSMTRQNAEHANEANLLMAETGKVVSTANASMQHLTESMGEISKASEETSKIIKTIDEIAFQTNLLALNAAVEAARAGEAGAGFAVVADEVRNLAMRCAEAARNTANLIEDTVKKIGEGSEIVEKTATEFSHVTTSSAKMGELIGEITAASTEQAQGIEQINKAVSEMDRVVQQNAANAEESASASEEMNAQAAQMKTFVQGLIDIVGGAGNGGPAGTKAGAWKGLSAKGEKSALGVGNIPAISARNQARRNGAAPSRAEKLIPMHEHEGELQDF